MANPELTRMFVDEMRAFVPVIRRHLATLASAESTSTSEHAAMEISRLALAMADLCGSFGVSDCADIARSLASIFGQHSSERAVPPGIVETSATALGVISTRVDQIADAEAPLSSPADDGTEVAAVRERLRQAVSATVQPLVTDQRGSDQQDIQELTGESSRDNQDHDADEIVRQFRASTLLRRRPTGAPPVEQTPPSSGELNDLSETEASVGDAAATVLPETSPATSQRVVTDAELDEIPAQMKRLFIVETTEDLQSVQRALLALERDPTDVEALQTMLRIAHKVKGAAFTFGFDTIAVVAHTIEDVLKASQRGVEGSRAELDSVLLQLLGVLESGLEAAEEGHARDPHLESEGRRIRDEWLQARASTAPEPPAPREQVPGTTEPPSHGSPQIPDRSRKPTQPSGNNGDSTIRVDVQRLDALMNHVSTLAVNRTALAQARADIGRMQDDMEHALTRLTSLGEQLEDHRAHAISHRGNGASNARAQRHSAARPEERPDERHAKATSTAADAGSALPRIHHQDWDELELDRYTEFDHALRMLHEAVADMGTLQVSLRTVLQRLLKTTETQESVMSQIQHDVIQMRLVPLDDVVPRLRLAARTLALGEGKSITFTVQGETTEIDRDISAALAEPLMQLVRNAIVHGIESPEERQERGKPVQGRLWMNAYYVGNEVTIEIGDDGRGVSPEHLVASAMTVGVVDPDTAHTLRSDEKLGLMFVNGVTTADSARVEAGRGVGLDEVRAAIQKLKGSIHVRSEPYKGTVFRIRVPISLSIVRVLQVVENQQGFAIPFSSVERTLSLLPADILESVAPSAHASESAPLRITRRIRIERVSGPTVVTSGSESGKQYEEVPVYSLAELLGGEYVAHVPQVALLVDLGQQRAVIMVDEVREEREVVVRALARHLRRPAIRGATTTPEGEVLLLLDLPELIETVQHGPMTPRIARAPRTPRPAEEAAYQALIVDDSVSMRRALEHVLTRDGIEVQMARDGLEALTMMMTRLPKVVILDIEMPRLDGYEFLSVLRGSSRFDGVRVVMLTSRSGEKHRAYAHALGADAYLTKPFAPDTLIETVRQYLRESTSSV